MTTRSHSRTYGSLVLVLVALAALGPRLSSAPQQEDQTSGSQAPKKELEPLAYFGGRWTCTGVFPSTGKEIASDIVARVGLEGAWLVLQHDDAPPNRFHATELWGFEPESKQFVAYIFDNFGGARKFTSPGWAGTQWIWSGESKPGPATSERFVFTRVSAKALTTSYEVKRGTAEWAVGDKLTCAR
jgi:hypothetical protein